VRAPEYWRAGGEPPGWAVAATHLWRLGTMLKRALARPDAPTLPLICVGNATAGGAGKSPVVQALVRDLRAAGRRPAVLSRGHGGRERGPLLVDSAVQSAADVGDEPLLHARLCPTVIARDRAAGARLIARSDLADVIVMDDGLQNTGVRPTAALLVIDGGFGFGNGRLIPAGPLREPVAEAAARVDAAVLIGADQTGARAQLPPGLPVFAARVEPAPGTETWRGRPALAFAGIGRPDKLFDTLRELGAELVETVAFPDHHPFAPDEIMALIDRASAAGATLVTTEKDHVRLPADARAMVEALPVRLVWQDPVAVDRWLRQDTHQ